MKETKDYREPGRAFLPMLTKTNRSTKSWVDKGTKFAGDFRKMCTAVGIQIYSTVSETKAAFAERIIPSLKNILYRYKKGCG